MRAQKRSSGWNLSADRMKGLRLFTLPVCLSPWLRTYGTTQISTSLIPRLSGTVLANDWFYRPFAVPWPLCTHYVLVTHFHCPGESKPLSCLHPFPYCPFFTLVYSLDEFWLWRILSLFRNCVLGSWLLMEKTTQSYQLNPLKFMFMNSSGQLTYSVSL